MLNLSVFLEDSAQKYPFSYSPALTRELAPYLLRGEHGALFRQLFEPVSSTYTYLLACPETREAVLVGRLWFPGRMAGPSPVARRLAVPRVSSSTPRSAEVRP